jgi:Subtilisin-like serine proteases
MKTHKNLIASYTFATLAIAALSFASCKKDDVVNSKGKSVQELAADYPDRLFVNDEVGVAGRYIVLLKESYLRPSILEESPDAERATASENRNSSRQQSVEDGVERFIAGTGLGREKVTAVFGHLISGFVAELTVAELKLLLEDARVESIEQDIQITVDDVLESNETEAKDRSMLQNIPCGISRHGGAGNGSGSSKWLWIVDSGIQSNHPDLNVVTNTTYARSFVGGSFEDCNGHGTHVAGTAAAKNNSYGVVGMSAGAWVVPIKIMSGCGSTFYISTLLQALNHIAFYDEPGDVINLSIGGYYGSGCSTSSPSSPQSKILEIQALG